MKRIAISLCIGVLVFLSIVEPASAQQGLPVDGKDFYIGFIYPSFNKNPDQSGRGVKGFFNVYALISSYDNNQVTVSYFDNAGVETAGGIYSIQAKNAVQVQLLIGNMKLSDTGEIPEYKSCHITAKKPVNVQYFSTGACSGGSYLAIPTPALGQHYAIPSYYDNPDGSGAGSGNQTEPSSGFFEIIAPFDGTNVTITPNTRTMGGHVGVSTGAGAVGVQNAKQAAFTVTLNRGQCYWMKGDQTDGSNDISGTTVVATRPIACIAGHEDAFLGGAPTQRVLEGRDFMIEQVIPSEYWDSTGYVSIPLYGAQPVDDQAAGYGSNYRVSTDNPKGAKPQLTDGCRGTFDMSLGRFASPTPEQINVACPVDVASSDGHKFGVMLYQLRDQGGKEPYPAESMMSIVPMSRWRTSYLFYVPANTFEILQDYFINIIALKGDFAKNIQFSHNGSTLAPLTSLGIKGSFPSIPNHPELAGKQYSVHPGAYYLTNTRTKIDSTNPADVMLQGAFMVYHYGMRAIDPDRDLGDFCGDDFFFSYALPIGMTVADGIGNPVVTVDTFCSYWHVCVHDSVPITSVTLIDDPDGNVYGKPGKQYFNAQFDPIADPEDKREIVFNGIDTSVCFDVLVSNPLDSAYAPIYIVDKKGTHIIEELHYRAQSLQLLLAQPQQTPEYIKIDTLTYPLTPVGQQICSTIVYINSAAKGGPAFRINKLELKNPNFVFNPMPALPISLKPGDTLRVNICFPVPDTLTYLDTLVATTDCSPFPLPVIGKGGTPLIYATDVDFGNVAVGTTKCLPVTISNKGIFPFVLTKNWLLHNTTLFAMDPANAAALPITIPPGGHVNITFCYTPTSLDGGDSTTVDWGTDIEGIYKNQIKSWSFLKGIPIKPGVVWDRSTQLDSVICEDSVIRRVYLFNNSTATTTVERIFFDGPDANEYSIVNTQPGFTTNINMLVHDTIWVDVKFKADLTKAGAAKYAPRKAFLVATYDKAGTAGEFDSTVIAFTGLVQHAVLTFNPPLVDLGFVTKGQPTTGYVTVINTGDAPFVISNITFPNPPILGITLNGKPLVAGDTIGRGDTVTLALDGQLDQFVDTTVTYTLFSDHSCGDFPSQLHIATSSRLVLGTGYPAPDVFVDCREHDSLLVFTSRGSAPITLKSVSITNEVPPGQFELVDSKGARSTTIITNALLKLGQSDTVAIVYHPTVPGPATATIVYTYDSSGTIFTLTKQATGNGIHLKTILSAKGSGQYTAHTGVSFTVPVSLVDSIFPANADVRRITFRLTYAMDVVDYQNVTAASANYTTNSPLKGTPAGNGMEYIDVDVKSQTGAITNPENLINVKYEAMVAIQTISPFILSNVVYFDAKNDTICYIATDTLPGTFVPDPLCGDTTLRNYLNGIFPVRITMLTPGVVGENESPVLYYSVNRTGVPVRVEIYNVLGEKVRTIKNTMTQPVGEYKLPIGTRGLNSGEYIVRLISPEREESANFILEK